MEMRNCCVIMCFSNKDYNKDLSFFRFPLDPVRRAQWIENINNPEYKNYTPKQCYDRLKICNRHFENTHFANASKSRLKKNAVPTLFEVDDPEKSLPSTSADIKTISSTPVTNHNETASDADLYASSFLKLEYNEDIMDRATQTSPIFPYNPPRETNMNNAWKTSVQVNITSEHVGHFLNKFYTTNVSNFIKCHMRLMDKSPYAVKYDAEYNRYALALHFSSPQYYKFLGLPLKPTLHRMIDHWDLSAGFNDYVFVALKIKVNALQEKEKNCSLCLDEMSLRSSLFYNISRDDIIGFHGLHNLKTFEPASKALVVTARGINAKWKQPIAYFFLNGSCLVANLIYIIFEAVKRINSVGLNVLLCTSSQKFNFYDLVKEELRITVERPYFFVGKSKIFYMFDVPQLLISTRNNLFRHRIVLEDGVTDKSYLEILYEKDKVKRYRLIPKISDEHIYPDKYQKKNVKLAAQVFSYPVVVALQTYISFHEIPSAALPTASFIEKINELFNILNADEFSEGKKTNKTFICTLKQINFLEEMNWMFKKLKVIDASERDVTDRMKFIFGWRLAISVLFELWQELKKDYKYILTGHLSQDSVEDYFGKVRDASGKPRNPTPVQFKKAYKKTFISDYFAHPEATNCLQEFNMIFSRISKDDVGFVTNVIPAALLRVDTRDYAYILTTEGNVLVYVCKYLIEKCLEKHSCDVCLEYSEVEADLDSTEICANFKAYINNHRDTLSDVKMPNMYFVDYIVKLECEFANNFSSFALKEQVGLNMKNQISCIRLDHPCPNFPKDYLLSLFVRVRIYYTIKFINRELRLQRINKNNQTIVTLQHL